MASMENIWSGSICCMRCANCSASSRVSNIMRLYSRPARTWSHLHIVSVIAFPPSNRLSSRFSSHNTSDTSSYSFLLPFTFNNLSWDKTYSNTPTTQFRPGKTRGAPNEERPSSLLRNIYCNGLDLLLLVHIHILCINNAFVLLRLLCGCSSTIRRCCCTGRSGFVHRLSKLVARTC